MNKNLKKTLSVILTFLMIVTMMPFTLLAKAAGIPVGETFYLKPGSHWSKDEARFAAYLFNNTDYSSYCWVDLEPVAENDGYYQFTVPEGTWDGFLFCRMIPGTTNGWENKWAQTGDLSYDGENNLFTVNEDSSALYAVGVWSKWSPEENKNTVTVYLINNSGWVAPTCYYWNTGVHGVDYPAYPGEPMTYHGNDGQYDVYSYELPKGNFEGFLFTGSNGGTTSGFPLDSLAVSSVFDTMGNVVEDYCTGHEWTEGG